jgi:2,4-dienoyl-CoA reductase-like NADH-dependent reductase (Old Yellow Enzyme family)
MSQWKLQDYGAQLAADSNELEAIVAPLVDAGVDLFDCSQRRFWEPAFPNSPLNLAGWVKHITGKPSMTVGSVGLDLDLMPSLDGSSVQPTGLDELYLALERGDFDLVAVGRAILVDCSWVTKIHNRAMEDLLPFCVTALGTLS